MRCHVSFLLLVATGIYLAQFYDPTDVADAHASVFYITTEPFLGELIRSLHYWLAAAFVVTLILHMVRAFAAGALKAPREFVWVTGVPSLPAHPHSKRRTSLSLVQWRTPTAYQAAGL